MSIIVQRSGFDIEKISEEIHNDIVEAIDDIANKIKTEAKRIARSFKTATGDLSDSIWVYINKEKLFGYVNVYKEGSLSEEEFQKKVIKSVSVEFGHVTRAHGGGKRTAQVRRTRAANKEVPPNPFLRPAFDKYKPELMERLEKFISETISNYDGK